MSTPLPVETVGPPPGAPLVVSTHEMRAGGFLQEANRIFFHPLGLALALAVDPAQPDAPAALSVLDYRADPEGVYFAWEDRDAAQQAAVRAKAAQVWAWFDAKVGARTALLGSTVQPLPPAPPATP